MTTPRGRSGELRLCLALALSAGPLTAPRPVAADVPFESSYSGTYHVSFGTGSGGNHELTFSGTGRARHLGRSQVEGSSELAPGSSPLCFQIVNDSVRLTAANGDELHLVNSGEDCLYTDAQGRTVIRGTGQMSIVGGTGRFAGSSGAGTWLVHAPVAELGPAGVDGTFELAFRGRLD